MHASEQGKRPIGDASDVTPVCVPTRARLETNQESRHSRHLRVIPDAKVLAVEDRNGVWSIRAHCPFCERVHMHGGGSTDQNPDLGSRVADCRGGTYVLRWSK